MWFVLMLSMASAARLLVPRPSSYSPAAAMGIDLVRPTSIPKLVVFDLDHTLWTPELYQLRKMEKDGNTPKGGKDVWLLPEAYEVLHEIAMSPLWVDTKIGIASRTHQSSWAHSLLREIKIEGRSIAELTGGTDFVQIYKGNKQKHFAALKAASGLEYHEMLFFDDARDGKYGNCEPVSELGVHAAYCPNGMTREVWLNALESYSIHRTRGKEAVGRVVDPPLSSTSRGSSTNSEDTVRMKVFSMNMPFAGLLAHGVKTFESRNGTVFTSAAKEGDIVLVHVGHRIYPDGGEHVRILEEAGFSSQEISRVTSLPSGFSKGQVVAIMELGETIKTTKETMRNTPAIEQAVVARGAVMGKNLTKVRKIKWLKRGYPLKGSPGMFTCDIPRSLLPDMATAKADLAGYSWEGGGGTDVCASSYNDDPFEEEEGKTDGWKAFQQRVAESIARDPTIDQKNVGSGKWP